MYFIPNFILTFYDISVKAYANAFEDGLEATFLAVMIVIDYVSSHQQKIEENVSATLNKIRLKFLRIMKVPYTSQSTVINFKLSDNCNSRKFISKLSPKTFKLRIYPIPPF